jgi:hypothetical protein
MDRPPTPLFMPSKSGVDVFTQIEGGDLFDFDAEVEPILEVRAVVGVCCGCGYRAPCRLGWWCLGVQREARVSGSWMRLLLLA